MRRLEDSIFAYLIAGRGKDEMTLYGGGYLEEWRSDDRGEIWEHESSMVPEPDLIYNNPQPVFRSNGEILDGWWVFYGWQGPEGIWNRKLFREWDLNNPPRPNRGKAFLWHDGAIIGRHKK
jgi:hypothetical protein